MTDLTVGERVPVRDVHGRSVSGAIADVSVTDITIVERGQTVIVVSEEVETVRRQDSIVNGILLGLAGGLVVWVE